MQRLSAVHEQISSLIFRTSLAGGDAVPEGVDEAVGMALDDVVLPRLQLQLRQVEHWMLWQQGLSPSGVQKPRRARSPLSLCSLAAAARLPAGPRAACML